MSDNLVIVESPAKAKTIEKYLGKGFKVMASMWHIRDLPKKWAIDIDNEFATTYEISPDKKKIVSALKKEMKWKDVWLATDEDREWEAIARHLCESLWLDVETTKRIVFREITKDAITSSIKSPRTVDKNIVNAQQARRVLDRLVWFDLSPVLWKKIKTGLSAGRVQSVWVRLIVEREREISAFEPVIQYKISWDFQTIRWDSFKAKLESMFDTKQEVTHFFEDVTDAKFHVSSLSQKPWFKNPSSPFTTSSLQQYASQKMWYSVSRTMQIAQRLYEAGHITYMRTDSKNLSKQAQEALKKQIVSMFWSEYYKNRVYKSSSKWAQEAHEAIRPTKMNIEVAWDTDEQKKLYQAIWRRTLASQMTPAKTLKTHITLSNTKRPELFKADWEIVTFSWFLKVYWNHHDDVLLPEINNWEAVDRGVLQSDEFHSRWPARYTEASLVKKLEELWIGRPSTYAPTISTIQKRWYVSKWIWEWDVTWFDHAELSTKWKITRSTQTKKVWATKWKLIPTDIWIVVTDFLNEHFEQVMNYQFTAQIEEQFDDIAHGNLIWSKMIWEFYYPFHTHVENVTEHAERSSWERILGIDPVSWKQVLVRIWRYWPLAQLWDSSEEDVKYAALRGNLYLETITLEQAMELFKLPRILWELEWKPVKASIWRFWPYVQHDATFASLKEPDDPYTVSYDRAVELLLEKKEKDKAKILRVFTFEKKEWSIIKWRWWPYIKWKRNNIKLPKNIEVDALSETEIFKFITDAIEEKKSVKKKKKKSPSKKTKTKPKSKSKVKKK